MSSFIMMKHRQVKIPEISIGLLMATELEAAPLIKDHGFKQVRDAPFPAYLKANTILVLSGIGKANAAAATAWMLMAYTPEIVCNAGAAGTTGDTGSLGDIFQIGHVVEPDRPPLEEEKLSRGKAALASEVQNLPLNDLPKADLATQDHPVVSMEERQTAGQLAPLVDMEGAAVVQTCDRFGVPAHLVKYVSDTHDGHSIVENIIRLRSTFCEKLLAHLGL